MSHGPREATSSGFARSAAYVTTELTRLGYRVQRQPLRVPAGMSWAVPVPAGTTINVVADPPGFDPARPHVLLGAHLDTVPQAPGGEDNASGVAVLLELARMLRQEPGRLPVRLVAFSAEEARAATAGGYAFGSRHYIASLTPAQRRAVVAMVSLDRVGVRAGTVPVCSTGRGPASVADSLRRAGAAVPTNGCRNRASDHWSFDMAGIPAARVGSVPYRQYHSAGDVPGVLDPRQLQWVGALLWSWLRPTA